MLSSKLRLVAVLTVTFAVAGGAHLGWAGELQTSDAKKSEKPKSDKEAILGTWKVVEVEENGKDASDTEEGKKHKGAILTISADKAVLKAEDDVKEFSYKINPDAKPKAIDFEIEEGRTLEAVYSLEGSTLKICGPRKSGGDRPAKVGTEEGSDAFLLVLKRESKAQDEKK